MNRAKVIGPRSRISFWISEKTLTIGDAAQSSRGTQRELGNAPPNCAFNQSIELLASQHDPRENHLRNYSAFCVFATVRCPFLLDESRPGIVYRWVQLE